MYSVEYLRKDGRQREHLSCQVGEVSQDKDEARLDDLDVFSASGHKRDQQAEHEAHEGTAKRHHKEGNWRKMKRTCIQGIISNLMKTFIQNAQLYSSIVTDT